MIVVPTVLILSYGVGKIWVVQGRDFKLAAFVLLGVCLIFFAGQSFRTIQAIRPSITPAGYLDLVEIKGSVPLDSVILAPRGAGLGYWVEYVENVEILVASELSPELWQSYSKVLGVFPKNQVPTIPHQILVVGKVYVLVEISQRPSRFGR